GHDLRNQPEPGQIPASPGVLSIPVLDAVPAFWRDADDVVVRTADRAGAALDTVAEAHDRLLLDFVPLIDACRAEVGAVLARTLVPADLLVADLDVGVAGVLDVAVGEELVGELLHLDLKSIGPPSRQHEGPRRDHRGSKIQTVGKAGALSGAERAGRPTARHLIWVMPAEGTVI